MGQLGQYLYNTVEQFLQLERPHDDLRNVAERGNGRKL
jgi:hypothetical protein